MQVTDVGELGDAEEALGAGVQRLLAVAEQYLDPAALEDENIAVEIQNALVGGCE